MYIDIKKLAYAEPDIDPSLLNSFVKINFKEEPRFGFGLP
jgi:hypothetical protein